MRKWIIVSLTVCVICSAGLAVSQVIAADHPVIPVTEYQKPEFCAACHQSIYKQWHGTMHSHSSDDPFYAAAFLQASHETKGLTDRFCSACHTPVGLLAGEIPPADQSKVSGAAKNGVFCDFCHTMTGQKAIGNAQYIVAPGEVKRGPFADSKPMGHKALYSAFFTKSEFCGTCHEVSHPINGLPLETTFSEWAKSPYNTSNPATRVNCQDCHMTPGPGVTKPNPGKASILSAERPNIYTHEFVGGGGVAAFLKESKIVAAATKTLQAAARLNLQLPAAATPAQPATIKVQVTNVGAGHDLPTGVTELRDMWLELIVTDAGGKQVFASGKLDAAGEIEKGAVKYGVVVADADGHPTPKFWLAVSKVSDHRIPPKQTVTETYTVPIPAQVAGPLAVQVRLRYRAASPALLRLIMGPDEKATLPVIDMAEAKGTLKVGE